MSKVSTRAYLPNIDIYNRFKSANNQIHLSTPLTFKNVCNAFKNGYILKGGITTPGHQESEPGGNGMLHNSITATFTDIM
jgi:hypothetical protein